MAEWTIYGSSGVAKATVKELELHDEWMAECFITVSVKSAEPIDFAVGDYIDYRNERYSINYDPSKIKKARRGTYGEGFVYDNIKFVAVQDELVRCDFCDIVLSDNQIHYTQLPTFPFYCETADDLLDRIQANMEDMYPGAWIIISPDLNRDRQRGMCVGREQAFVNAYNQYIGEGSEFTYEKTGVALTVDNINCWEALAKVNSDFALNFIVRDRIVIVGTAGVFTPKKFRYGKGNGLYELEVIGDSEQKLVTLLKAYGSENNLPERYYATKGGRPFFKVSEANSGSSTEHAISVLIDNSRYSSVFTDVVDEVSSSQKICIGSCEIDGIEFDAAFELVKTQKGAATCTTRLLVGANGYPLINGLDLPTVPQSVVDSLKAVIEVGTDVIFNDGVDISYVDDSHVKYASGLPENMAINKLMLPGFPEMSLDAWVRANRPELIAEGFEFSTNALRPYIDSPNKNIYGIRPDNIFFDGSNETEEIYPTIEGMEWEGNPCDVVVSADQITDNGVLADDAKEVEKRVSITIPYAGFDLNKEWTDGATISMKNGMCGARDFKILKKPTRDDDGNWVCVCERAYDSTLHLYFPYSDFQIHAGDKFVLTGIDLPDSYVDAASEKLFDAAMDALRKNHLPRVTFQPRIDHLWMARQHDTAMGSDGTIESLHDTLKAGDYFSFVDEDFGVDTSVIIDILTIKEHADNGLATYEVTLRDEKAVSTLQKRLEKIASSSGVGSNGGSYSMRQTGSLVEQIGNDLYLSKIEDDQAQGWIGFLKGAWFGAKEWLIDATGSANLFNATVNGVLKAYNAVINTVKSVNFTGYGMLDTGWSVVNDYEGTDSYAVFDRIYVRKKAIFEALELRKISHIGGNFCLSPASGRAYQVEYYDADGQRLGMEEKTVPWLLGYKVMMLFSRSLANKFLGRQKLFERPLTEAEKLLVKRVRVYLFSDDGTTKTMSNWTVGAQARCQTFNIEEQTDYHGSGVDSDNPDVSYWTGEKVQNTYWWRLVNAVGKGTLKDGKTHSYIEFLCNTGNDYVVADTGSDLPAVGDEFAQFGHRTDTTQQNVVMIETANPDSPSIKFYKGVNSWNLNGKRKTILSPQNTEIYSQRYHIETAYDDVLVPVDRGAWADIEPDAEGKRRCYYYDRVSHNGSLWLCIVPENSSTTDEPSESSVAWLKQVAKGDKGETSFKSLVFKRSATKPEKPTGGSYANPVPSGWSDGIPSGTETIWMTSRIFTTDGQVPQQSAWTTVQLMSDTESFDVEFSPVVSNPGNPTDNPNNWFDPSTDPTADWENMIWMAERTKNNGIWGNWEITKIKGEKGSFKSRVFKRTNTDISSQRPTGGTYDSPIPTSGGWTDGIPSGAEILWSSVRTFDVSDATTQWSLPVKETDTATLDLEFSPNATCPAAPYGNDASQKDSQTYINQRQAQGWYDPSRMPSNQTMIWRAERKIANGAYSGDWVMTRIYGEKGDAGNFKSTVFKRTNTTPVTAPTGGTYANPVPSGWSDGVPDGQEILWASTNVFYSTGGSSGWTAPKQLTDTADFDVEFSSVASPNPPSGHPNTNTQWSNTASASTIWMATSEYHNGVWSDWQVSKIKGEQGIKGNDATTTALKYTGPLSASDTKPTVSNYKSFTWTDNIPTQTEAKPYVYVGVWQYTAGTTLDISKIAPTQVTVFAHYGKDGNNGRGITSVNTYFKADTSQPTTPTGAPTSAWSDDGSTLITNANSAKHLYESTCTSYTDGTYSWTTPLDDGLISDMASTEEEFALANSGTTAPTSGWGSSVTPTAGKWIWSRTKLTFNSGNPKYVSTQCVGYCGTDGASITKSSETYRYATNNTGTRPAASSSDWKTTKPTLNKGYWLYTETTITWSDNSKTVLYTDERNPNDGNNGQDIIVDGSTVMKYYVGDSNTTHPDDGSSDWKDLSQVTQTQGKWLWSQATTYYRKASSTAGSHDAGSSINYNVSYISKDGKTGRGISSITEFYQATNSSAARQAPTSTSGWSTDPNLSDLTDKWNESHKYLWNMEKTVYSNVDGTTTTNYSIPQILAIWTKDGAAGKGIDSIQNYYKITNSLTPPARTDSGWDDDPIAPTASNPYLYNYEAITWVNPSSTTYTAVQMIGHYGTDGISVRAQYSANGTSWHDTFADGDKWMRTSTDNGTSWSTAMKIIGENGSETDFSFGISQYKTTTNAQTAPSDISSWSDAPMAVTSAKPYLWSKVVQKDGNGTATSTRYVRLTGEDGAPGDNGYNTATVYLYKRSSTAVMSVGITTTLYYKFSTPDKLYTNEACTTEATTQLNGWSRNVPATDGNPLYVTAATAYANADSDPIAKTEWATPVKMVEDGKTPVVLDISNEMDAISTTSALKIEVARKAETIVRLYKGDSEVDISSATFGTTGTATISGGPASTIATFSQEASGKGKKLSWAFIAGQTMAEAYNITISYTYGNETYTATFTICASKGEAVWQLKPSMSAIQFSYDSDNHLTPGSRSVNLSLLKIDGSSTETYTSAQTGITVRYSLGTMPTSATEGTNWQSGAITVTNTANNLYLAMFNASGVLLDRETVPVVRGGVNGKQSINSASVFLYQRKADAPNPPTNQLTYYFQSGSISGTLGDWRQVIPAADGNPCWVIQATALSTGTSDTISGSEWSTPRKLLSDGEPGNPGKNGTSILAAPNAIIINQQRTSSGAEPLTNITYPIVVVARDSGTIVAATISNVTTSNCTASIASGTNGTTHATVNITAISYDLDPDGTTKRYKTSGSVSFHVVATTAAGDTFSADLSVPFGCNLLGQYTLDIDEDMKTEVSSKVTAEINDRNLVNVSTMNTAITQSAQGLTQDITRVDNRLNAGGDIATSISNTNQRVDNAESSIQTISTESLEYIDVSKWEKGSTDNESAGKTYSDIKTSSDTRIRLKSLIPITASTAISMSNTSYQIGLVYFGTNKKTVVYSGSSAWRGWTTGSDSVITTHPSSAVYVAIVLKKVSGASIATSEVSAAKLYISDTVYSTVKQTADKISATVVTPLRETGINITDGTITANADNFLIKNSSGVGTIGINSSGDLFSVGNARFKGGLHAQYMYSETEILEVTSSQGERHIDILGTNHKYNTFYIIANGTTKMYLNLPSATSFDGIELCFFHPVFTSSTGVAFLVYNMTGSKLYAKQNGLYAEVTYSEGCPIPKNMFIRVRSINDNWFVMDVTP